MSGEQGVLEPVQAAAQAVAPAWGQALAQALALAVSADVPDPGASIILRNTAGRDHAGQTAKMTCCMRGTNEGQRAESKTLRRLELQVTQMMSGSMVRGYGLSL